MAEGKILSGVLAWLGGFIQEKKSPVEFRIRGQIFLNCGQTTVNVFQRKESAHQSRNRDGRERNFSLFSFSTQCRCPIMVICNLVRPETRRSCSERSSLQQISTRYSGSLHLTTVHELVKYESQGAHTAIFQ